MAALPQQEQDFFWQNGYLVVPDVVSQGALEQLHQTFQNWVEESRGYSENWGETLNGKPRYDLEPGHCADSPRLRRVNAPVEVSKAYFNVMADSTMTDCVAALIGPDVKLHHTKINSKHPGGETSVKWQQDFPFTPHSNDSVVTAL